MPHDARVPTETCSARLWTPCQSVIGHRQRLVGLPHRAVLILVPAVHRAAARVVGAAVVLGCAVRSALCRLPAWARAVAHLRSFHVSASSKRTSTTTLIASTAMSSAMP